MELFKDVLCPYCLQKLRSKDLKMTCERCGTEAIPSKAELIFKKMLKCKKDKCHGFVNNKQCKHCNKNLPSDILDYEKYLRFSILGITGSGKTSLLTTMLHELRHTAGSPWIISPMDRDTAEIFRQNEEMIYTKRQPVPATPPGNDPPPQLWRVKDGIKKTKNAIPSHSMTIFDGAGEDCEHINPVISRYIKGSKVLVILIDPLALPGVAKTISSNIFNRSTSASHNAYASVDMVEGLANYIRQSCNIAPQKLINCYVAVVFTKIDVVRSTFGSATVMQPSPHMASKGFIKADLDAINVEIRDWLKLQNETAFLEAIETNFVNDKVKFFGVSSFGQPPTDSNQLGRIMSHRVLDPLLWMLSKEGIVPTI